MLSRRTQSGAASNERQAADLECFVDMRSVQNGTQNCERRTTADIADGSAPNGASALSRSRCCSGDRARRRDRRSNKCNEIDPPSFHFGRRFVPRVPRVAIRPFAALGTSHLPVTWASATSDLVLGGVVPPDSPVHLDRISPAQSPAQLLGGIRRPRDIV